MDSKQSSAGFAFISKPMRGREPNEQSFFETLWLLETRRAPSTERPAQTRTERFPADGDFWPGE